ncbi:MAG: YdcF family protein [Pseudonocardia sp.]
MTMDETIIAADVARITAYLDVEAHPTMPTAHIIFGTNQTTPAEMVARRYHQGLAPFIILTGGVNRHTGVLEAIEHRRVLLEHGVPEAVVRYEDSSTTTRGNVERALPLLHEAQRSGLVLTAVCKWYHRRAIQLLRALLPSEPFFHAVTWEPIYDGVTVTRSDWWLKSPVAAQRVLKEWRVIPERLAAGSLKEVELVDGAWR